MPLCAARVSSSKHSSAGCSCSCVDAAELPTCTEPSSTHHEKAAARNNMLSAQPRRARAAAARRCTRTAAAVGTSYDTLDRRRDLPLDHPDIHRRHRTAGRPPGARARALTGGPARIRPLAIRPPPTCRRFALRRSRYSYSTVRGTNTTVVFVPRCTQAPAPGALSSERDARARLPAPLHAVASRLRADLLRARTSCSSHQQDRHPAATFNAVASQRHTRQRRAVQQ